MYITLYNSDGYTAYTIYYTRLSIYEGVTYPLPT